MKRSGFTMIELVFVIIVLGILASIAIPRLAVSRTDAEIAKGRSDIAAIRAAIVSERQSRLLRGESNYISSLHGATSGVLFDGNDSTHRLLQYGIKAEDKNGHWNLSGSNYVFKIKDTAVAFTYSSANGTFTCNRSDAYCADLID